MGSYEAASYGASERHSKKSGRAIPLTPLTHCGNSWPRIHDPAHAPRPPRPHIPLAPEAKKEVEKEMKRLLANTDPTASLDLKRKRTPPLSNSARRYAPDTCDVCRARAFGAMCDDSHP